MISFFEDETHYYVEMTPFGRPGTDLFDWIELHTAMTEAEVKSIFHQTCSAIEHLHTQCGIVHRDIKDENVVLDHGGRVKVIDFGSAAYLRDGPFDTFHGTLDYASPEVLGGKKYEGRGQDVWAAGILLYTMIYKENPFYNVIHLKVTINCQIDEIVDRDLRIPFIMSDDSIDLIQKMLDRDLSTRYTMAQVLTHPVS
jgi:protein-serine/threonine kinase